MIKRNIQIILLSLSTFLMISLVSCDPSRKYEKEEESKIQDYLANNFNQTFVLKPSGLYYLETLEGTGSSPVVGDSAFIRYTGTFLDGTVFDNGPESGQLYGVAVGSSITGFDEGLMLMKEGGKAIFLIPSKLAYGATGVTLYDAYYGYYPFIPGYAPLLFTVELVRVLPKTGK